MAATLGHWFEVRIELLPIEHGTTAEASLLVQTKSTAGAPGRPEVYDVQDILDQRRLVRVTVRYKERQWVAEKLINTITLERISVVVSKFTVLKEKLINVTAFIKNIIRKVN